MYYRAEGNAVCADVIPYYENGRFYLFYLKDFRDAEAHGEGCPWCLLTTEDLVHYEEHGEVICRGTAEEQDLYVYFDEEKQKYGMLLAVRSKCDGPAASKGATLALYSDDLYHWSPDRKLFYAPAAFYTHECPDLFYMGGWWYLIFSEFTDKSVTTYRMARSIGGPWITPKVNTFDGHAFYAAKTASDGKRRLLFGWNGLRRNEDDDQPWIWGGTIIPHELAQDGDGTLYVKCPKEIQSAYHVPVPEEDGSVLECHVDDRVAMSARMFNRPEGSLALYAQHMTADFRNISIMTV